MTQTNPSLRPSGYHPSFVVTALLGVLALVIGILLTVQISNKTAASAWALSHGYQVEQISYRFLPSRHFFLKMKSSEVYNVVVRDRTGTERTGQMLVKVPVFHIGDRVEMALDSASTRNSTVGP